jgi:hypothetical protein
VAQIVASNLGGHNLFSRRFWSKCAPWTVPSGLCEESADGLTFRNTVQGDMGKSVPRVVPQMKVPNGPLGVAFRRQRVAYGRLKKVLVDGDGKIYRATHDEIAQTIAADDRMECVRGLTAAEYVFAVTEMFLRR